MTVAKSMAFDRLYHRLETKEGEKDVFKLARIRKRRARDLDGKDTFPISSIVKGWKIPEAGNDSVVRGVQIRESAVISARTRLKRP